MKRMAFFAVLLLPLLFTNTSMAKLTGDFCWNLVDRENPTNVVEMRLNAYNAGANHYFCSGIILEDDVEIAVIHGTVEAVDDKYWITTTASGEKADVFWTSNGKILLDSTFDGTWKEIAIVNGAFDYTTYDMDVIPCE